MFLAISLSKDTYIIAYSKYNTFLHQISLVGMILLHQSSEIIRLIKFFKNYLRAYKKMFEEHLHGNFLNCLFNIS